MENDCVLEEQYRDCKHNCGNCGMHTKEAKRRKGLLATNGLTVGKDGLQRLIITKPKEE